MSQTGVIFAALFAAFIVFITAKGELPAYVAVLTGKATPKDQQQANAGSGVNLQDVATAAEIAAMFA